LRTVPGDWGPSVSKYRYVYHDNRVLFVEPSNRRVVHVIDSRVVARRPSPARESKRAPGFFMNAGSAMFRRGRPDTC
jgi:hypothetical protein